MKNICLKIDLYKKPARYYLVFILMFLFNNLLIAKEQSLNLEIKNGTLYEIVEEIEQQTDYLFIYNNDISDDLIINLTLEEKDINEVLTYLKDIHNVDSKIENRQVFLIKTNEKPQLGFRIISGIVIDEQNQPITGANVTEKGTTNGTVTDIDGNFVLKVNDNAIISISYIGYLTQNVKPQDNNVKVILEEDTKSLEEIVVVGFGTQKKVNMTGAVSSVTSQAFQSRPVQNASQALQGMVPGLNVSASLGGVNAKPQLNIRGKTTIGSGSTGNPLILIDGMEGDINTINPQDIESISVLKDAASSSIYGSRAPFGVILVTTKKGRQGKIMVNYNTSLRFSQATRTPNLVDSYRFALVVNQAAVNDNRNTNSYFKQEIIDRILAYQKGELTTALDPKNYTTSMMYNANGNTNWYNEYFNRTAFSQEHSLSVNGGNEKSQIYASVNYLDQDGLLKPAEDNYKRLATNVMASGQVYDWLKFNYNVKFNREDFRRPYEFHDDAMANLINARPNYPVMDDNGFYYEYEYRNPNILGLKEGGTYKNRVDNMYQQFRLIVSPIKNLNINAEINYRLTYQKIHEDSQIFYNHNQDGALYKQTYVKSSSYVSEYNYSSNYLNPNIYTDYSFNINNLHNFKAMLGFQTEHKWYDQSKALRNGIIIPGMDQIDVTDGTSSSGSSIPPQVLGNTNEWAIVGFFGRLNYDYRGRYLAEVNLRYDGTSRFRSDKRWKLFPSYSVGWNIAREVFWEDFINVCNELKLRGSYGVLGNQNTTNLYPTYVTQPLGTANGGWLVGNVKPNTAWAPQIINSAMSWEMIQTINLGFDFALVQNRLTGSFDWFRRKTKDMVGPAPEMPVILGTSVPEENNTELESKGWELNIKWQDQLSNGVNYNIGFNISDSRAKILKYPNPGMILNIPKNGLTYGVLGGEITNFYEGQKLGEIWGYKTIGIAKTQEEMDAHLATLPNGGQNAIGKNFGPGDIMYEDLNHDGKISTEGGVKGNSGDLMIIGNSTPRYLIGFDLGADWKGLDFRLFLQGVLKKDFATTDLNFMGMTAGVFGMLREEHLNYFRAEADDPLGQNLDSYYPRVIVGTSNPKNYRIQSRSLLSH